MSKKTTDEIYWVAEDGSYGFGRMLTFNDSDMTPEQWDKLSQLNDYDRIEYALAVINGEEWEDEE